jgi:sulfur carrier protein
MPAIKFHLNGELIQKTSGQSLAELASDLELTKKKFAIEMNGEIIPKSLHASTLIEEGAIIEIVHAVGGG